MNLGKSIKGNKKGNKYVSDKRKTRANGAPLLKETGQFPTQDSEMSEVLYVFLVSVLTSKTGLHESQVPEARLNGWSKEDVSLLEEDQVREYLIKLDIFKFMGFEGCAPVMIVRPLSTICLIVATGISA